MSYKEQLEKWVKGESVHMFDPQYPNDTSYGSCCPDFSCCNKAIVTPKEERELFFELYLKDTGEHERMLMMFLGRAFNGDKKIYVAGGGR